MGHSVEVRDDLTEAGTRVLGRILAEESARFSAFLARAPRSDLHDALLTQSAEETAREVITRPLDQVDWLGLENVARWNAEAAAGLWLRLQTAARDELESGHLAADALDVMHSIQDRAHFLAVRAAFNEDLQPRGAVEQALIDLAVHAYLNELSWLRGYHARTQLRAEEVETYSGSVRRAPAMDDASARAETMDFFERFHRLFLRTLRALDDHRRRSPVIVQNAGQVNVAERQINLMRN